MAWDESPTTAWSRRRVLASAGIALGGSTAGCSGVLGGDGEEESTDDDDAETADFEYVSCTELTEQGYQFHHPGSNGFVFNFVYPMMLTQGQDDRVSQAPRDTSRHTAADRTRQLGPNATVQQVVSQHTAAVKREPITDPAADDELEPVEWLEFRGETMPIGKRSSVVNQIREVGFFFDLPYEYDGTEVYIPCQVICSVDGGESAPPKLCQEPLEDAGLHSAASVKPNEETAVDDYLETYLD